MPHLLQVVVLARNAQALLGVGRTRIFAGRIAQEDILELVHARVGKHQRGIVFNHHWSRRHNLVTFTFEETLE